MNRRDILAGLGASALAAGPARAAGQPAWLSPQLPDGTRAEATVQKLPGKQGLICLADRPPNYESPIDTFGTAITPNDRFFVRYHLAGIPSMADLGKYTLSVGGDAAERPFTLGLDNLRQDFAQAEVTAVCQCSGNRRGLSSPHVAGVEWGYGAMGDAVWRGPRLKDVLAKAGVKPTALEVWLNGADGPVLPTTPDFQKSLPMEKAMADEVIIATTMNGAPLPHLNGFPARLVVPGWTATYWMKQVADIRALSQPLASFWMNTAYRIPKGKFPVIDRFMSQESETTTPITEILVNSLMTNVADGQRLAADQPMTIRGIAWDGGYGIRSVEVSIDGGRSWQTAELGESRGRFSFRGWQIAYAPRAAGRVIILARASSVQGTSQPAELIFNAPGYHNNVAQKIAVDLV